MYVQTPNGSQSSAHKAWWRFSKTASQARGQAGFLQQHGFRPHRPGGIAATPACTSQLHSAFKRAHVVATVYTDAFFELGDRVWKLSDTDIPSRLSLKDNQPGLIALQKGFGRDDCINLVVTWFWVLVTHQRWVPEFRWVPSALNIADPISRGDMSMVQPSWRRLITDPEQLEAVLLQLNQETVGDFPAAVRAL